MVSVELCFLCVWLPICPTFLQVVEILKMWEIQYHNDMHHYWERYLISKRKKWNDTIKLLWLQMSNDDKRVKKSHQISIYDLNYSLVFKLLRCGDLWSRHLIKPISASSHLLICISSDWNTYACMVWPCIIISAVTHDKFKFKDKCWETKII